MVLVFQPSRPVGKRATSPAKASSVPGHQTDRRAEVIDIGEAAGSGLVAHFRGPRSHALEAKVTHCRLHLDPGRNREAFNAPRPLNDVPQQ